MPRRYDGRKIETQADPTHLQGAGYVYLATCDCPYCGERAWVWYDRDSTYDRKTGAWDGCVHLNDTYMDLGTLTTEFYFA